MYVATRDSSETSTRMTLDPLGRRTLPSRFPAAIVSGNAPKASLSKYYGKGCNSTIRGDGWGGDVPVLTRVLDLARPAVCALGPLTTHLEVSATCRQISASYMGDRIPHFVSNRSK